MNISINSIPWQKGYLVLTLKDKQEGLADVLIRYSKTGQAAKQRVFLEFLNEAESITTQAITRMMRQRSPR